MSHKNHYLAQIIDLSTNKKRDMGRTRVNISNNSDESIWAIYAYITSATHTLMLRYCDSSTRYKNIGGVQVGLHPF